MAYIGRNIDNLSDRVKLDAITASATATYNLLLSSAAYTPSSAESLTVSLNGVIQAPQTSYTVSGSTIIFASALTSSDTIDFILAERAITLTTIGSGTVATANIVDGAVTGAKLNADVKLGKYGQIVYSNNGSTGTTTSSNNSWTDTTLTGTITPSATTSKIELHWVGRTNLTMTATAFTFHMDFKRAISGGATTSQILEAGYDSALSGVFGYDNRSAGATLVDDWRPQRTQSYLDSPSTTSAITYTCQFKANAWAGSSGTEGFYANGILVLREVLV